MIGPSHPQDHKPTARRCAEPPHSRTHSAFRPQNKMEPRYRRPGVLRYPSVAVAATAGGSRAPAVREEAARRRWPVHGAGGKAGGGSRDFERGSAVVAEEAEETQVRGGKGGRVRRASRSEEKVVCSPAHPSGGEGGVA
ncbi:hypothetical protein KM043_011422 [Ampulex compressa]|nr:hypothetical protein KM043_011422 [Ampulex compressa]